ncbi:hypothetical protein MWU52_14465 [Jannaschia sp. S6380]|uniref:hypothetical protein n=1 Tax=Jannaschia sp. S6380 TaxID=2926408 RepID=UPI001FF21008|nr:hypothetical protein [Jannaschia sp. S6380]MCK0168759.1 hypothetical protein [Jannaschia sp. S6380]
MIDRDRIAELEGEIGADDLALIARTYFAEAEAAIATLDGDTPREKRHRILHFLRSGALNIGFRGMADAAAGARSTGGADMPTHLRAALSRTRAAFPPDPDA